MRYLYLWLILPVGLLLCSYIGPLMGWFAAEQPGHSVVLQPAYTLVSVEHGGPLTDVRFIDGTQTSGKRH